MKPRTILILVSVVVFFVAVWAMLMREVSREEEKLAKSISGRAEVAGTLFSAGVVEIRREDRAALILLDPVSKQPVAMKMESPFLPPAVFHIGQEDARGPLEGSYYFAIITDKDGEILTPVPGEVYGITKEPIPLGSREVVFHFDQPFKGGILNEGGQRSAPMVAGQGNQTPPPKALSISGTITVPDHLASNIQSTDRMILLLFDPQAGRPVANKIIPHVLMPQKFFIGVTESVAEANKGQGYFLRVITDKDNNPVGAAPGELVGRSKKPIQLGTENLNFLLDQPYKR